MTKYSKSAEAQRQMEREERSWMVTPERARLEKCGFVRAENRPASERAARLLGGE